MIPRIIADGYPATLSLVYRILTRRWNSPGMLDPYMTLQVERDATAEEIKQAYRRLAKELHPDLHPDNPVSARRFKDVTAAYDVLSDEAKRRQYDRQTAGFNGRGRDEGMDGIFRRGWGFRGAESAHQTGAGAAGQESRGPVRGADIYQSLRVSFVDAVLGAKRRVVIKDERAIDVAIPPLTEDGQTLRLKGQGGRDGRGSTPGDLYVEITVEPHALFTRRNFDIHMTLPVTLPEAVLGGVIPVPTLHGLVQLKIPRNSNTDTVLRLRGKGIPVPHGGGVPGDQLVTLKVVLPEARDAEFLALVEEWSRRHSYNVRPKYGD
jgi:DnaJ-class molecular chaperone